MYQNKGETPLLHIFIDADSCPVKQEVYRVASRYQLEVTLVANSRMQVPSDQRVTLMVVHGGFDAADDWIVEHAGTRDIVVTADVLLADRCLKKGALVVGPTGKPFTEQSIGSAVAARNLMAELRSSGEITGGPPPLKKQDRSCFLHQLDAMIQSIRRTHPADCG
ncbi:YaiI/YqxD family protein [Desulfonatronum thioautotrophicum]|uniref:YaiI/YqxD family protein n=1 Tax=Desulfonatronum thioautotrophicum TaxID=617001 RepID=UPI0005EB905F|nr:YaiI/YqxD family protein [Desulfonatronum thioautotrophicum]